MIGSLCQGLRHMQAMRNIVKSKCSAQVAQNQQIIQLSFPLPPPALLNLFLRFRLARTRRPVFALNNLPMCRTSLASNAKEKGPCPKQRKAHTKAGFPRIPNGFYIPVWDSRREFTFPSGILYSREGFQSFRGGVIFPSGISEWDFVFPSGNSRASWVTISSQPGILGHQIRATDPLKSHLGLSLGLWLCTSLGTSFGLSLGTSFGLSLGTSFGLSPASTRRAASTARHAGKNAPQKNPQLGPQRALCVNI